MGPREIDLLTLIGSANAPIGARELSRGRFAQSDLSESTINRLLRQLDHKGLTLSDGGRGRVLSPAGKIIYRQLRSEFHWRQKLRDLNLRTIDDIQDLLVARRAVERETVRLAAQRASSDQIAELESRLTAAEDAGDRESLHGASLDFHRSLRNASNNQMLQAMSMVVFDPRFDILEKVLEIIASGSGSVDGGRDEHRAILDAIIAGDPDEAETLMLSHLDHLIDMTHNKISSSTRLAIELYLDNSRATWHKIEGIDK